MQAGNILIDAPRGRVLLADLGVAAAQQRCFAEDCNIPKTGQYLHRFSYVGSPAWMAPEVMEQCDRGCACSSHSSTMHGSLPGTGHCNARHRDCTCRATLLQCPMSLVRCKACLVLAAYQAAGSGPHEHSCVQSRPQAGKRMCAGTIRQQTCTALASL